MSAQDGEVTPAPAPIGPVRVAVASGLHVEFGTDAPDLAGRADLLVTAGDIAGGAGAIGWLASSPVPVVYLLGNQEFYGRDIERTRAEIAAAAYPHIIVLDDQRVDLEFEGRRLRVLGSTLWTDYCLYGEVLRETCRRLASAGLNDHRLIRFRKRRWTPADAAAAFEETRRFLSREPAAPFDGVTLVATHHAPTPRVIDPRYAGDFLGAAFASDLGALMDRADGWIYGHTHRSADILVQGCRVVSNQRGYEGEHPDFTMRILAFARRSENQDGR